MAEVDFSKLMDDVFKDVKKEEASPAASGAVRENKLFNNTKTTTSLPAAIKKFFIPHIPNLIFKKRQALNTGLDIGTSAIKTVVFSYAEDVPQLVALDIEEIPHTDFESASRREVLGERLKRLQARHSIKGNLFVSMALPNLLVEFIYLPAMPQDELDKAIRWEAKEKLLVDEEYYVIDYLCLGEVSAAQQVQKEILFFSVPKKDILEYYKLLASAGLRPQAIRPSFLASFQAFQDKSLWRDDEVVGFLDIGAGGSSFSVISGGYIHFTRHSNVSSYSMTRSIADYCQLSYDEAEHLKREVGMSRMALEEDRKDDMVAQQPRVRLSHAMGLHLDQLITEVQHTFNYFSLQVSNVPLDKMNRLIITGGGALVKGICEFLRSRLDIPVEVVNPFNYVNSKVKGIDPSQLLERGSRFAAAVGLAKG